MLPLMKCWQNLTAFARKLHEKKLECEGIKINKSINNINNVVLKICVLRCGMPIRRQNRPISCSKRE